MIDDRTDPLVVELTDLADVARLVDVAGPFASAVLRVPTPGGEPDELATRWHSVRHRLSALGAPDAVLDQAGELVEQLPPVGRPLYVTAAEGTTAYRWLDPSDDGEERVAFDSLPDLLPVVATPPHPEVGIGVAIDHIGAEVIVVSSRHTAVTGSVDGRDEHVHLAASGGWSQRRHQAHTRLRWERNAQLVAEDLTALSGREVPDAVVVTGDERSRGYLLDHLPVSLRQITHVVSAGGRSDPDVIDRLAEATSAAVEEVVGQRRQHLLDRLAEELGQHDRATAGAEATFAALAAGSVETLFVDRADDGRRAWFGADARHAAPSRDELEAFGVGAVEGRLVDVAVRAALGSGAAVVAVDASELPGGAPSPAALLRYV